MRLSRFASSHSEEMARRQRRGLLVRRLMTQPVHQPMPLEDQALLLYALKSGRLDRLTDEGVQYCLAGLLQRIPEVLQSAVRENQPLTPALCAQMDNALDECLKPYRQPEDARHAVAETPAR